MTRALGPAVVVVAALAVPLFYIPGFESPFADPKLALLLVAGGVGLAAWLFARAGRAEPAMDGGGRARSRSLRAAVAALVIAMLLAAAVAAFRRPPGAPYAIAEIVRLAAMLGVAAGAAQAARDPVWRRRLFEAIHVSAGVVSVIGLLQHVGALPFALPVISTPGSTFGNRNMAGEAIALAIPFGFATVGVRGAGRLRSGVAVAFLLAELLFLAVTRARGAWIGGAAGVVVFLAVRRPAFPRSARLLAFPVVAAVVAAALLPGRWRPRDANDTKRYEPGAHVVLEALDPASSVARTRLGLWRRTLAIYGEHPFFGVGPGNFPVLFPLHAEPSAAADGVMSATMIPRRPHNELIERLAETGPLGLAAFAAVFVTAIATAFRIGRAARAREVSGEGITDLGAAAAAAGAVAACFACGITAFPLAMPATVLQFGVALGLLDALAVPTPAAAAAPSGKPPARWPAARLAAGVAAIAVAGGACWLSYGVFGASYWRGRAKAAMAPGGDRPSNPAAALAALDRAAAAPRIDGTRFDIALRAAQVGVLAGHGPAAYQAANRALALEPYSPHALAARAAAELALGDEARAEEDARHAMTLFLDLPSAANTAKTIALKRTVEHEADTARRDAVMPGQPSP
jgi:O-antigen ligase